MREITTPHTGAIPSDVTRDRAANAIADLRALVEQMDAGLASVDRRHFLRSGLAGALVPLALTGRTGLARAEAVQASDNSSEGGLGRSALSLRVQQPAVTSGDFITIEGGPLSTREGDTVLAARADSVPLNIELPVIEIQPNRLVTAAPLLMDQDMRPIADRLEISVASAGRLGRVEVSVTPPRFSGTPREMAEAFAAQYQRMAHLAASIDQKISDRHRDLIATDPEAAKLAEETVDFVRQIDFLSSHVAEALREVEGARPDVIEKLGPWLAHMSNVGLGPVGTRLEDVETRVSEPPRRPKRTTTEQHCWKEIVLYIVLVSLLVTSCIVVCVSVLILGCFTVILCIVAAVICLVFATICTVTVILVAQTIETEIKLWELRTATDP